MINPKAGNIIYGREPKMSFDDILKVMQKIVDNNDIDYIKETKYYDKYYLKNGNYFNLESKEVKRLYINKIKEA